MLSQIKISNFTLIDKLAIEPVNGLNIITGETGAGKSIVLGAIGLLLGQRADGKAVSSVSEKCVIEGTFSIREYALQSVFEDLELEYEDETIIRREITQAGKSRLFINDSPTTQETAKELGRYLVDIHSQHDTLLLGSSAYQLSLIDSFGKLNNKVQAYKALFDDYKEVKAQWQELKDSAARDKKELDFLMYQLKELQALKLEPDEQSLLEEEQKLLLNAEDIKLKLSEASFLYADGEINIELQLKQAVSILNKLQEYGGQYPELYGRAESSLLELRDVFQQLQSINDDFSLDEKRLNEVQARLSSIYLLQKKHGLTSVEELLAYQKELELRTNNISNLDEKLQDLADAMNEALVKVKGNGAELSKARKAAAEELLKEVHEHLADLSMPYSKISAEWKLIEPSANGLDGLTLLFSANKGIAPAELKQVASGGEFSRLMLCIKYSLARRAALPTLIFDEIDSGISGEVGRKVGKMIQDMARYHQVIAITHLPQIASLADAHFFVYKNQEGERTTSMMKLLAEDERVEEIATMMSGSQPSASALAAAKELMVL